MKLSKVQRLFTELSEMHDTLSDAGGSVTEIRDCVETVVGHAKLAQRVIERLWDRLDSMLCDLGEEVTNAMHVEQERVTASSAKKASTRRASSGAPRKQRKAKGRRTS